MDSKIKEPEIYMECDDCGKRKPDVHHTTCPYSSEINETEIDITICNDCFSNRADDI